MPDTAAEVNKTTNSETEQVAPMADNSADENEAPSMREIYGEGYAPIENAYTVEQELDNIRNEIFVKTSALTSPLMILLMCSNGICSTRPNAFLYNS